MVETLFGILVTVLICAIVVWLTEKLVIAVPTQFGFNGISAFVIRAVFYLILLAFVLDKYGVYHIATK